MRYIAFLRAINVGGHTVKMEQLRQLFESLGLTNVETVIASGNVVFESKTKNTQALEKKIEATLNQALGYAVATFIRSDSELATIANYQPFPVSKVAKALAFNVAFLSTAPDETAIQKLMGLQNAIDDFHVHRREVYWLCRKKQSDSKFSNAVLEKTLKQPSTLRGIDTLKRIAEKYCVS
ncbi:MAG: DUF1697 domain-containing protein [Chloroflexi bacterium]|nr:DUF1697 domain-containing protein [Chloroflexota bacterium]